jgi:hypothetical protein
MSIPLPLKIITIVIVVLVILLIIAVRKKQKGFARLLTILILLGGSFGIWKGLKEYNRTNEDLGSVKADVKITALQFIAEYEANNVAADEKFLGKVVETAGTIKKIEKDEKGYYTIVLGDTTNPSSVRCSMDTTHNADAAQLAAGSSAILRGACTGFNRDEMGLGSDVILNRCAIISRKDP